MHFKVLQAAVSARCQTDLLLHAKMHTAQTHGTWVQRMYIHRCTGQAHSRVQDKHILTCTGHAHTHVYRASTLTCTGHAHTRVYRACTYNCVWAMHMCTTTRHAHTHVYRAHCQGGRQKGDAFKIMIGVHFTGFVNIKNSNNPHKWIGMHPPPPLSKKGT